MSALTSLLGWIVGLLAVSAGCGIAAGVAGGWVDARGGGPLAHSGPVLHLDLTLVGVVAVTALAGVVRDTTLTVVWTAVAALSFVTILVVPHRGLRGALAGLALGIVGVFALLDLVASYLPGDPAVFEVVRWVRIALVLPTAGVCAFGGWAVGGAVTGTSEIPTAAALREQSQAWVIRVRQSVAQRLLQVRPFLGKVALWSLGLLVLVVGLAALTGAEALVAVAVAMTAVIVISISITYVLDALMGAVVTLTIAPRGVLAFLLGMAGVFRRNLRAPARTVFVLTRYPNALCDTCLRTDAPLASSYTEGERTCSKCGGTISFEGGKGRLVVVFDEGSACDRARVFVRRASELVSADKAVDVTHVRLTERLTESEVERLVAFLRQRPPSHALKQVKVYADTGRNGVRPYLYNILSDHFSWSEQDPFAE